MYYSHIPIVNMDYTHEPLSQRSSTEMSKDTLLEKNNEYEAPPPRKSWRQWLPMMIVHGFLITMYTVICITVVQTANMRTVKDDSALIDSPARPAVENIKLRFDYRPTTMQQYFGRPSEAVDERWDNILDFGTIKFSKDDMTRYGRSHEGVQLADGTGYMGTLNVFHELHCLKRIYMYIHKDKYFADQNLTAYEERFNLQHTMHCMDTIRQGIQCRADISPVTYQWGQNQRLPVANFTSPHECKSWDKILSWAKRSSFDPTYPGLIVHPKFGAVYDDRPNMGRKIGIVADKAVESNDDLESGHEHQHTAPAPSGHHREIANYSPKIHDS